MTYNLASNRFGLFLEESSPPEEGENLVSELRAKISSTIRQKHFQSISHSLLDVAREIDPSASLEKSKTSAGPPEVVVSSEQDHSDNRIFVGFFPHSKLRCQIGDVRWIVFVHASVAISQATAKNSRQSLWWTFEGVPSADSARPREADATSFFEITEKMKARVMPALRAAYEKAAHQLTPVDTVRICLADVDSRPFAELLDSLYLHRRSISEITDPEPVKGLEELREYAYDIGKLNVTDTTLNLSEKIPGVKAVFCRADDSDTPGKHSISIAGFAHPNGLSMALSRPGKSEQYVRTMSAARKLSSKLVEQEIAEYNRRHATLSPQP